VCTGHGAARVLRCDEGAHDECSVLSAPLAVQMAVAHELGA